MPESGAQILTVGCGILTDWAQDLGKLGPDLGHFVGSRTAISETWVDIIRSWKRHGLGPFLKGCQKEINWIAMICSLVWKCVWKQQHFHL